MQIDENSCFTILQWQFNTLSMVGDWEKHSSKFKNKDWIYLTFMLTMGSNYVLNVQE